MRRFSIAVVLFFCLPLVAQAACYADGYEVVFINGIWTTKEQALGSADKLRAYIGKTFNNEPVTVTLEYNPTHLGGAGDLIETVLPTFDEYDLQTMLMHLHDELTTRKLIIVGHSQGAVYANKIYEYLTTHGVPKDAVAVYAVGTPSAYVAGGGKYLNYEGDTVIYDKNLQVGAVVPPLPNLFINDWAVSTSTQGNAVGHGFIDQYLANFSQRITSDIKSELWTLRPTFASETGECFTAPEPTLGYKTQKIALLVSDPLAVGARATVVAGYQAAAAIIGTTYNLASAAVGGVASLFGSKDTPEEKAAKERAASDTAFAFLHALNLTSLSAKDADQLLGGSGKSLGGAAVLALEPAPPPLPPPPPAPVPEPTAPLIPPPPPVVAPIPGGGASAPVAVSVESDTANASSADSSSQGSANDSSGSPAPDPLPESSSSESTTTPEEASSTPPTAAELMAANPPVLTFSNWDTQWNGESYCAVINRTMDLSWSAVPGATSYELGWLSNTDPSPHVVTTTTATSYPGLTLRFGLGSDQVSLWVAAHDDAGDAATTTVLVNSEIPDTEPPSVAPTNPAVGATGVSINAPLVWTASEPVDAASVQSAFYLRRIGTSAAGSLTWFPVDSTAVLGDDDVTITVTPSSPLEYDTGYWMTASCQLKDPYGNHAGTAYFLLNNTRYFTTESAPVVDTGTTTATTTP